MSMTLLVTLLIDMGTGRPLVNCQEDLEETTVCHSIHLTFELLTFCRMTTQHQEVFGRQVRYVVQWSALLLPSFISRELISAPSSNTQMDDAKHP